MIIYQITRTLAGAEVEAVLLPLQRLLEELLEAGGQAAQVQLLAPAHQLQHLIPQLLIGSLPLCIGCRLQYFNQWIWVKNLKSVKTFRKS